MKPKTLVLLTVATGCGLIAMFGVQQVLVGQQVQETVPMVKVLVALEDIDSGVRITGDNTKFKEVPATQLQADSVRTEEQYKNRAAKVPILVGDVVRKSKMTEPGEYGKSINIPVGMRVISIPVNDTHTISGLLQPKDRVDVLVTFQGRAERGAKISKTKTLLEYVEVFSCDDVTANGSGEKEKSNGTRAKNVALLVTPEQANYVILAMDKGSLSLSWRRRGDDSVANSNTIDEKLMEELQGTIGDPGGILATNETPVESDNEEPTPVTTVSQFLNEIAAPTMEVAPVVAEKPTWSLTIFNKNLPVVHKVEIPEN
ncbi:Flp pilus assembly protein CpaB [Planctomicrobium sp. SH527]|uniref:Flp pilus assembly protein CpaB n=1 Tax=Planctomicrobium sp. SH527 TaxID=3448123 RepID=UPI003F5B53AF